MKLRIRHATVTKVLTLEDGRSYTIGQVKAEIKSQIAGSLGLATSTNFGLSLNGSVSLGGDGVSIQQAGVVGGDLIKIVLLPHSSSESASTANQPSIQTPQTTEVAGPSPSQDVAQHDYASLRASRLRPLFELGAVRTPFHVMCVWIHCLMLDNRFNCECGSSSEVASSVQLPVFKLEYTHLDAPETIFILTVTQLGPFVLINGIVRPCRNTDAQVISLQVKQTDYVISFASKPSFSESVLKNRDRMTSLFKTDIANKAVNAMRAELHLPPLGGLLILPPEMLMKVFAYLEPPALCTLAQACRSLQQITADDSLWETLFRRSFPASPFPTNLPWKEMFKREFTRRQREERERREYMRDSPVVPPNPFAPIPGAPIGMPFPGQPLGMLGGDYDLDPGFPYGPLARPSRRSPFGPMRPPLPGNPLPGSRFDPMYPGGGRFRPGRGGGMMDDGFL